MAINSTESAHKSLEGQVMDAGPYLARVVNHLDSTIMGGLEVLLYEGGTADSNLQSNVIPVYYMSPFWGTTSVSFEGNNSANFQDVQKSYGMWMVPPDIGSCVMVIFVRGMSNAGYWIGCVPDTYQNHMVPGIAASRNVALTTEQERKYGTTYLPVGEFLKRSRDLSGAEVDKFTKPVHPFADRLLEQGLIVDDIRGVTSSSARREYPSSVFGISTPGPIDTSQGAKTGQIGFGEKATAYVSRLGGSQFVMDDGDKQGLNELVRIRTRTGHQILLHNSSDLIYIANAKGTAWIELTSQGKIDAYSADSISLHAEGDFNLRADRDFNIEAGRNVKIAGGDDVQLEAGANLYAKAVKTIKTNASQEIHFSAGTDLYIGAQSDVNITAASDNLYLTSGGSAHIKSTGDMFIGSTLSMNINGGSTALLGSKGAVSFNSNATISIAAKNTVNILGEGSLNLTSPDLNMNSNPATAGPAPGSPNSAQPPTTPDPLQRYNLPNIKIGAWSDGEHYRASDLVTIMTRVPTHEPWPQHESVNPDRFSYDKTDSENTSTNTYSTVNIKYNKAPTDTPPKPTGNIEEDNIAAFLWTIRVAEGTASKNGYVTQYTGAVFDVDNPGLPNGVTAPSRFQYYNRQKLGVYGSNSYSQSGGKIVVVGDSLAVGTGSQIAGATVVAKEGISSSAILKSVTGNTSVQGADLAIISAGANDGAGISGTNPNSSLTISNIKAIKAALNAKKYVWILPYNRSVATDIIAAVGNDDCVDLKQTVNVSSDNLHPSSYAPVAASAISKGGITSGGSAVTWNNNSYKFKDHPRIILGPPNGLRSSAAGAYQFMPDTWDDCKRACKLPDFSPASQDKGAIYLIQQKNALEDVKAGRFARAAEKVKKVWASFKGAGYGQREIEVSVLATYYKGAGGTIVS